MLIPRYLIPLSSWLQACTSLSQMNETLNTHTQPSSFAAKKRLIDQCVCLCTYKRLTQLYSQLSLLSKEAQSPMPLGALVKDEVLPPPLRRLSEEATLRTFTLRASCPCIGDMVYLSFKARTFPHQGGIKSYLSIIFKALSPSPPLHPSPL